MSKLKIYYFLSLIILTFSVFAQNSKNIPEKPEDISPLLIGEKPTGSLISLNGTQSSLESILQLKPTILIFYRGGWCPYCNMQLKGLQTIEQNILDLGYQIVAVSPDSPENLNMTIDKNELNYELYSDPGLMLAQAIGIAFQAPERHQEKLEKYSAGKNKTILPVPSVFVLDQRGVIQFEYINPNYKERLDENFLMAVIKTLQ